MKLIEPGIAVKSEVLIYVKKWADYVKNRQLCCWSYLI